MYSYQKQFVYRCLMHKFKINTTIELDSSDLLRHTTVKIKSIVEALDF